MQHLHSIDRKLFDRSSPLTHHSARTDSCSALTSHTMAVSMVGCTSRCWRHAGTG